MALSYGVANNLNYPIRPPHNLSTQIANSCVLPMCIVSKGSVKFHLMVSVPLDAFIHQNISGKGCSRVPWDDTGAVLSEQRCLHLHVTDLKFGVTYNAIMLFLSASDMGCGNLCSLSGYLDTLVNKGLGLWQAILCWIEGVFGMPKNLITVTWSSIQMRIFIHWKSWVQARIS